MNNKKSRNLDFFIFINHIYININRLGSEYIEKKNIYYCFNNYYLCLFIICKKLTYIYRDDEYSKKNTNILCKY